MKKLVLIVDDEELARLRIVKYLEKTHADFVVTEASDGFEALDEIAKSPPDLIFLDIEMPELSGFDVLHQLEERPFKIIFQTAYDEFAVRAFDANACDYLLKPFSDTRLEQAIQKAFGAAAKPAELERLDSHLIDQQMFLTKLVIKMGSRAKLVDQDEIFYFLSESHHTRVFLDKIDYVYDYSLKFLEDRLDPRRFLRLHRNSIVRVDQIVGAELGQNAVVKLKNGVELAVSRERKKQLQQVLAKLQKL